MKASLGSYLIYLQNQICLYNILHFPKLALNYLISQSITYKLMKKPIIFYLKIYSFKGFFFKKT